MKLSTIVSEAAWLCLLEKGYLICDDVSLLHTPEWSFAYEWMMEQMVFRIGPPPSSAKLPLWAWYRYYGGRRKSLMSGWGRERGEKMYRLDFIIDDQKTLLSDFAQWHGVLLNCYMGTTLEQSELFDAEFEGQELSAEKKAIKEELTRASWETIFDLNLVRVFGDKVEKTECIQACLWKIELSQVTKVQPYVSTGYKWKTIKPRFRCLHDKIQPPFDQYSEGNITTQC